MIRDLTPDLQKIIHYLSTRFHSHTIILYGSRAGNDFRSNSDYDLLCIREHGHRVREIINLENIAIDLIVDNEAIIEKPFDTLYLWQSKILKDEKDFGKTLTENNRKLLSNPPEAMPENRIKQRKKQIIDELTYIKEISVVGQYRRHEIFVKLRTLYLSLNCIWDLGDKHTFTEMRLKNYAVFCLFEKAMRPDASIEDIKELVDCICSM